MGYTKPETRKAYQIKHAELLREKARQYYKDYPDKRRTSIKKSKLLIDNIVYKAKSIPCKDCGIQYPTCAMQFDHVAGIKSANIALLRTRGSMSKLLEEMAKCEVVCANCHAIRTCVRDTRPKARQCVH